MSRKIAVTLRTTGTMARKMDMPPIFSVKCEVDHARLEAVLINVRKRGRFVSFSGSNLNPNLRGFCQIRRKESPKGNAWHDAELVVCLPTGALYDLNHAMRALDFGGFSRLPDCQLGWLNGANRQKLQAIAYNFGGRPSPEEAGI